MVGEIDSGSWKVSWFRAYKLLDIRWIIPKMCLSITVAQISERMATSPSLGRAGAAASSLQLLYCIYARPLRWTRQSGKLSPPQGQMPNTLYRERRTRMLNNLNPNTTLNAAMNRLI